MKTTKINLNGHDGVTIHISEKECWNINFTNDDISTVSTIVHKKKEYNNTVEWEADAFIASPEQKAVIGAKLQILSDICLELKEELR